MHPISEQKTTPIPSSNLFHTYLEQHKLTWVDVAHAARVPGAVVWLIDHGRPVLPANASKVRQGLYKLTGIAYTEPIKVITPQNTVKWG